MIDNKEHDSTLELRHRIWFALGFLAIAQVALLMYWLQLDDAIFTLAGVSQIAVASAAMLVFMTCILNVALSLGGKHTNGQLQVLYTNNRFCLFLAGVLTCLCSFGISALGFLVSDSFFRSVGVSVTVVLSATVGIFVSSITCSAVITLKLLIALASAVEKRKPEEEDTH